MFLLFSVKCYILDKNKFFERSFIMLKRILSALIALTLAAAVTLAVPPVETSAAVPVSAFAGEYAFDLSPLGFAVVVEISVDDSGFALAIADLGFDSYYLTGEIIAGAASGGFYVFVPEYDVYLPFFVDGSDIFVTPDIWELLIEAAEWFYSELQ